MNDDSDMDDDDAPELRRFVDKTRRRPKPRDALALLIERAAELLAAPLPRLH
jgi:hypothetical protein